MDAGGAAAGGPGARNGGGGGGGGGGARPATERTPINQNQAAGEEVPPISHSPLVIVVFNNSLARVIYLREGWALD